MTCRRQILPIGSIYSIFTYSWLNDKCRQENMPYVDPVQGMKSILYIDMNEHIHTYTNLYIYIYYHILIFRKCIAMNMFQTKLIYVYIGTRFPHCFSFKRSKKTTFPPPSCQPPLAVSPRRVRGEQPNGSLQSTRL